MVVSSSSLVRSTRSAISQLSGLRPVASLKCQIKLRSESLAPAAIRAIVQSSSRRSRRMSSSGPTRPRRSARDGAGDILRLAALAMRRQHQPARDGVGDLGAEILADDVEAEVDAGGRTGGGQHVAVIDIEDVGLDRDGREFGAQRYRHSASGSVARRPSSSPARAGTNTPEQSVAMRAPRALAAAQRLAERFGDPLLSRRASRGRRSGRRRRGRLRSCGASTVMPPIER